MGTLSCLSSSTRRDSCRSNLVTNTRIHTGDVGLQKECQIVLQAWDMGIRSFIRRFTHGLSLKATPRRNLLADSEQALQTIQTPSQFQKPPPDLALSADPEQLNASSTHSPQPHNAQLHLSETAQVYIVGLQNKST